MLKSRKKKKTPKRVLALPDLEQAKSAVLNTLTSKSGQRTYDHAITEFVEWYCSEPRLAFNRTVVLRYRISLEQKEYAPSTINLRLAAVRRIAYEAADSGLLSPELAAGIRRVKGVRRCMRRSSREDKDVIHSKFAVGRKLFMAGAARISDRIEATAYEQAQKPSGSTGFALEGLTVCEKGLRENRKKTSPPRE